MQALRRHEGRAPVCRGGIHPTGLGVPGHRGRAGVTRGEPQAPEGFRPSPFFTPARYASRMMRV